MQLGPEHKVTSLDIFLNTSIKNHALRPDFLVRTWKIIMKDQCQKKHVICENNHLSSASPFSQSNKHNVHIGLTLSL